MLLTLCDTHGHHGDASLFKSVGGGRDDGKITHTQAMVIIQSSQPEARTMDTRIHSRVRTIAAAIQVTVTVVAIALGPLLSAMAGGQAHTGREAAQRRLQVARKESVGKTQGAARMEY